MEAAHKQLEDAGKLNEPCDTKQSPQQISQVKLGFLECWVLFKNSMHQR